MGKRSRKRPGADASARRTSVADPPDPAGHRRPSAATRRAAGAPRAGTAPHARTLDRRARMEEAPKAPWAPFPLVELCILLGIVAIVLGFADVGGKRGWLLIGGFTLVTLAALELAIR